MALVTLTYQFASATTEPPTGSQLRLDADVLTGAQKIWVRYLTTDGVDAYYQLRATAAGWTIWLQDKDDHTRGARYHQTGAPIDKGGYFELPVAIDVDTAPLLTQIVILGLSSPADSGTTPTPPGGPALVTLDQLKARLRITTSDEDVDLQDLLDQAHAQVLNWCGVTASSKTVADSWTSSTVPPVVAAAILVQAGELDRYRGDDADAPPRGAPDGEVLGVTVRELLRPYHDLAMA